MKWEFVRRDIFRKVVEHRWLLGELVHDDRVYIRRQEEDVAWFQVWSEIVRSAIIRLSLENARHTGVNYLALVVQKL